MHPIVAAKQAAAIDDITNGRFALNVVCGWQQEEMEMFGTPMLEKKDRYACAAEWLEIVKRLWTEEGLVDFEGRFYKIKEGYLQPKPIRRPHPPVMNAGTSDDGKHFAAKYCDMAFIPPTTFEAYIVQGDTEEDARAFYHHYVHEKGDWKGAAARVKSIGLTAPPLSEEALRGIMERFIAGGTGYPLIGTRDQIVDGLRELSAAGLDGILLTWPRFHEGILRFRDEVHPMLLQLGLR
jgi:alkanesulfonate monooxygenase SsuD/methylene tetrahydromethanopterin reductase-like flavin-dependent oxidoreductase (luciferase family)